jgi:hypothetical protein
MLLEALDNLFQPGLGSISLHRLSQETRLVIPIHNLHCLHHGHSVAVQTASQQRGSTGAGSRSLTSSFAIAQDPEDGQYTIKVESDDESSWEGFPDSENENIFMDKYESGS